MKIWAGFFLYVGLLLLGSALFKGNHSRIEKELSALSGVVFALIAAVIFALPLIWGCSPPVQLLT